jgi:hypothetical protein
MHASWTTDTRLKVGLHNTKLFHCPHVQNQLELAGSASGQGGGQALAAAWHAALEASAGQHFPGNQLINCMCHNTNVSAACYNM